jgi:mono/diheme cytochrome c family protein
MIYAAIAFWLILGFGVIFIAMRGGPRGARQALYTRHRTGGRAIVITGLLVSVAFGLAVPALVLVLNSAHRASAAPAGIHLDASATRGRTLFARACATCHTLHAANAVGRVGPNLDVLHPPEALVLDAIANGRARGMGQMPAGLYQGRDAQDVAHFVAVVAGH